MKGDPGDRGPQGLKGDRGPTGPAGRNGKDGVTRIVEIERWYVDPDKFVAVPFIRDGDRIVDGPRLDLRPLFDSYHEQTSDD
jgi:hypothetical protein